MKKLIFLLCLNSTVWAQNISLTLQDITLDPMQEYLNDFQGISYSSFILKGDDLVGKSPTICIKEYKNGELVHIDTLLNGQADRAFLTIDKPQFTFIFFTQVNNESDYFKTFLRGERFGAGKKMYALEKNDFGYVMRDFFGVEKEMKYSLEVMIPLLVIIPPYDLKNGSGSYCDVVNSGVAATELGKHYDLKQYFLVDIQLQ